MALQAVHVQAAAIKPEHRQRRMQGCCRTQRASADYLVVQKTLSFSSFSCASAQQLSELTRGAHFSNGGGASLGVIGGLRRSIGDRISRRGVTCDHDGWMIINLQ